MTVNECEAITSEGTKSAAGLGAALSKRGLIRIEADIKS